MLRFLAVSMLDILLIERLVPMLPVGRRVSVTVRVISGRRTNVYLYFKRPNTLQAMKHFFLNKMMKGSGILLIVLLPLTSAAQKETNKFIGTWQVDASKSIELMDRSTRVKYDSLKKEIKLSAVGSMADREFTFNADESVLIHWSRGGKQITSEGTWALETVMSGISITVAGRTVVYTYLFSAPDVLQLKAAASRGLFNALYLKRK